MNNECLELKNRIIEIIDFKLDNFKNPVSDSIFEKMKLDVEKAYKKNNLKGLKRAEKDMMSWINSLSKESQRDFEEYSKSLNDNFTNQEKSVQMIVEKGEIDSNYDYRLVSDYLSNTENLDLVNKLNNILIIYEKK